MILCRVRTFLRLFSFVARKIAWRSWRTYAVTSSQSRESQLHDARVGLTVSFSPILVAFFSNAFGQLPVGSQRPFGLGIGPIQPIMDSRCLSAAGIRLLRHPIPPGDFRFTCDPPTGLLQAARTSWGLPRSAIAGDAIGLGALSAAWALGIRVRQPGNCGFLPKALGISQLAQGLPNATSTKDSLSFAMPIFPWP